MSQILFTPASVLGLLTEIEELKDKQITLTEASENEINISIGDTSYSIQTELAEPVDVDDHTLDTIEDINEDGYQQLKDDGVEFVDDEPIEGGIVKELLKTLWIGGLVRANNKYMSQDQFDAYAKQAKKYRK